MEQICGVLNINKERGLTSHDVVAKLRRILGLRRIGHTGTLDPGAAGVLVVCLGRATRIAQYLEALEKTYEAELVLGITTTTEDATGEALETKPVAITDMQLEEALERFRGPIRQIPPMYSAIHHRGRRLYELAREGKVVARKPREVVIHNLELLDFQSPVAKLYVECSKGTYIRTLCADIGQLLGCGGHMGELVRIGNGHFTIKDAVTLKQVEAAQKAGAIESLIIPMNKALAHLPAIKLDPDQALLVAHGRKVCGDAFGLVRLQDQSGRLLAVGQCEGGICQPVRVFH